MAIRVAINGFGRIGRLVLAAMGLTETVMHGVPEQAGKNRILWL